jgi:hypothetical protein
MVPDDGVGNFRLRACYICGEYRRTIDTPKPQKAQLVMCQWMVRIFGSSGGSSGGT